MAPKAIGMGAPRMLTASFRPHQVGVTDREEAAAGPLDALYRCLEQRTVRVATGLVELFPDLQQRRRPCLRHAAICSRSTARGMNRSPLR
jgi:hypothetical protein